MKKLHSDQEKKKDPKNRQKLFLRQFKMFIGADRDLLPMSKKDPISFFCCDPKWPQCRFNFAKEHILNEEFVFKVENYSQLEIFQDYFVPEKF